MKSYKSTENEVGKKDKKLKDIENSKSAANQRSTIDTLSRQLQDERKASFFDTKLFPLVELSTFFFLQLRWGRLLASCGKTWCRSVRNA